MENSERVETSHRYWSGRAEEYSELHERELASDRGVAFAEVVRRLVEGAQERLGEEAAPAGVAAADENSDGNAGTHAEGAPAGANPVVRALDLGCGSGLLSILMAQAGAEVTGVDFSAEMVGQAKANAERHGVGAHASFLQADVHKLPFEDESFDLVMTRNVTWVLDDVERVYVEALRVLRPGGSFVNIDASYGQAFAAADARGEIPTHPTQTLEQLRTRNAIVADLPISHADRPAWDIKALERAGARTVGCNRRFDATLDSLVRGDRTVAGGPEVGPSGIARGDRALARLAVAGGPSTVPTIFPRRPAADGSMPVSVAGAQPADGQTSPNTHRAMPANPAVAPSVDSQPAFVRGVPSSGPASSPARPAPVPAAPAHDDGSAYASASATTRAALFMLVATK